MIEERLLGFDVREQWVDPDSLWDDGRRKLFLLRADAPKPLSTDVLVWPSVFDTGQGIGLPPSERARLHLSGIPTPSWIGANAGLWESLAHVQQYLADHLTAPRRCAVIAVSWLSDTGFSRSSAVGPYLEPTVPAERDAQWKLLGFDVADGSLVSGLSNSGYSFADAPRLRRDWVPYLNSSHLFIKPAPALRYREITDARVPEHAPFFAYGLYVVEELGRTRLEDVHRR
jgi:hypothetical protein